MTKRLLCLLIFILLTLPSMSLAQEDTWTRKADMPTARLALSTSVVDGKIYAIGGLKVGPLFSIGLEFQSDLDEGGNISTGLLREFKSNGISVSERATISIEEVDSEWKIIDSDNGFEYLVWKRVNELEINTLSTHDADRVPLSTVEVYDPATDTWTKKADMPTPRGYLSTSVVDGKIYAIGGAAGDPRPPRSTSMDVSTVEVYDPVTDTWTERADMPTARAGLSTSVVNGKIYAIGGTELTGTVEEYDPMTDTWTERAYMPTPRWQLSTSMVNGRIYAIGGATMLAQGGDAGAQSTVEEYDPSTDTWARKADMPTPRRSLPRDASAVNGRIYVIGGWLISAGRYLSTVEVYEPSTDTWMTKADMPTGRDYLSTSAVNGRIYAIGGTGSNINIYSTVEEYDAGVGIRVTTISPQESLVTGGEPIAIFGSDFPTDAIVTIGGRRLSQLKVVADTLITGVVPPGTEGEQDVWITAPSIDFAVFAGKFFYYPLSGIVLRAVIPTNGKQAGGDTGSVTGRGFLPGATVTIGGTPATDIAVAPTLITFTIPPGTEGAKDVVVTNPDGQKRALNGAYTYNPFPVIKIVRPGYGGPLRGGTEITIIGSHFMQGIVVTIGENRVQKLDLFSPTELHLKTPPGEAGTEAVRVVNPDGQEAILEDGFTYNPAPTISSVKPNVSPLEGGMKVIITGTGFLPVPDVLIGDAEAHVGGVVSPTEITAETPPSTPGVKDVVVINRDGQRATLKDGFTYNPLPQIARVIPDNGRLAGGTKITIQGSGFLPGARVLFSTEAGTFRAASSIQVVSPAIIMAVTPPGKPGPEDVAVFNPDRQIMELPGGFTYNPMPTITRITPDHGTSAGGTKLTIEGTGFLQGARVVIGERAGTTMVKDDMTIEAVTPPNPPGLWDVRIVNPDTQEAVMREAFLSIGELVYNYPNPFLASEGTTFRYVTNQRVEVITVKIFNLRGAPIGIAQGTDSNEVRWHNPSVHPGLYVYMLEARIEGGKVRRFKNMLEVRK